MDPFHYQFISVDNSTTLSDVGMSTLNETSSSHALNFVLDENIPPLSTSNTFESSKKECSEFTRKRKSISEDFPILKRVQTEKSNFIPVFKKEI